MFRRTGENPSFEVTIEEGENGESFIRHVIHMPSGKVISWKIPCSFAAKLITEHAAKESCSFDEASHDLYVIVHRNAQRALSQILGKN